MESTFFSVERKKTIYIYGNHDSKQFCDHRVCLFSTQQALQYQIQLNKDLYHIEHGHLVHQSLITTLATLFPVPLTRSVYCWIFNQEKQKTKIGEIVNIVKKYLDVTGNDKLESYVKKMSVKDQNSYYIFGHSHIPSFSQNNSYLNPGKFTAKTPKYIAIKNKVTLEGI